MPEVAADVVIDRVHSGDDLNDWLDVAGSCGWVGSSEDRSARRTLYSVIGLDHSHLTHWIARRGGTPVGMASSFVDSDVIDLCNLAVVEPHRRTGIGRGLVIRRVLESQRLGARLAVSGAQPTGLAALPAARLRLGAGRGRHLVLPPRSVKEADALRVRRPWVTLPARVDRNRRVDPFATALVAWRSRRHHARCPHSLCERDYRPCSWGGAQLGISLSPAKVSTFSLIGMPSIAVSVNCSARPSRNVAVYALRFSMNVR